MSRRLRRRPLVPAVLVLLGMASGSGGCSPCDPYIIVEDDSPDDGADDAHPVWDVAVLEVHEPSSPSIHPLGEPVHLLAQVWGPDGTALPVDDVGWVTSEGDPLLDRLEGDVELPAGLHELSAVVRLPNGDRLQTTVGGVRVQAWWTGVYKGDVTIIVEAQLPTGGPLALRCEGPLDFTVGLDGRDAPVEDGGCTISVLGQNFEASYAIEIVVYPAGLVRGTVLLALDTPFGAFDLPLEYAGAFYDDRFSAGLSGQVDLPFVGAADLSGSLHAMLVDRYVDPDEG
ncbi:hypothetical protein [Paraliomyxa miuraensis]|uniref:hypothetical protein n=1 Tax=Paraliomyxa miuraensis TaxID=376150 RepID=UPI00225961E0|nr:hypothetical protein [Paraliomyxa miuraensis]MCX4246429.1 hypothetical protein [Paraliomyxa miuraensis]